MWTLSVDEWQRGDRARRSRLASDAHGAMTLSEPLQLVEFGRGAIEEAEARRHLSIVKHALASQPLDEGFVGIDGRAARRRSVCAVRPLGSRVPAADPAWWIGRSDADPESLLAGSALLSTDSPLGSSVHRLQELHDRLAGTVLEVLRTALGAPRDEWQRLIAGATLRARLVLYDPAIQGNGCGLHPDGNLLSFLLTDQPGLRCYDRHLRPYAAPVEGVLCMAGSILARWTRGLYPPVFHDVEAASTIAKTSFVSFLNLRDRTYPLMPWGGKGQFVHDVRRFKLEDLSDSGPWASHFRALRRAASAACGARATAPS